MNLSTLSVAMAVFVTTNVDDLLVLLGFYSDPRYRAEHIVAGQFLGMGVLIGASLIAGLISLVLPPQYLGVLGLAPLLIGLTKLYDLRQTDPEAPALPVRAGVTSGFGTVLAVCLVTLANGADNIGVYVPLFATRTASETTAIVASFAVMTAVWCLLASWLVRHRLIGGTIRTVGRIALPFVLIGLGCLILYQGGSLSRIV